MKEIIFSFYEYLQISAKMSGIVAILGAKRFASKVRRRSLATRDKDLEERATV
jgi:hypothetical protein